MGKRKIRSTKCEYKGREFDSLLERDFFIYLTENQMKLDIELIDVQPTFILINAYKTDCLRCDGAGTEKSLKTGRDIKCRSCRGTGKSQREEMTYTADFMVHFKNGKVKVYDVKGWKNDRFPVKKKIFENKYDIRLIEVYKKKGVWVYK